MIYWNPLLHSQWFLDLTQFQSQKHIFLSGKPYSRKLFICRQRNIWETLAKVKWMVTCFSVHVEVRYIGCELIFDCKLNRSLLGGCQCSWIFKVLRVWFGLVWHTIKLHTGNFYVINLYQRLPTSEEHSLCLGSTFKNWAFNHHHGLTLKYDLEDKTTIWYVFPLRITLEWTWS